MAADKKGLQRDALKQVQAGKIDKAIETYRAMVKLDPRDAPVRNALGDLLGRQGKKKEAIAEYLEASRSANQMLTECYGFIQNKALLCRLSRNYVPGIAKPQPLAQ